MEETELQFHRPATTDILQRIFSSIIDGTLSFY